MNTNILTIRQVPSRITMASVLIILIAVISGCSTYRAFKASRRVNLTPFAENTIAMTSDINYGLWEARPVYLRPHVNGPEVQKYAEKWGKIHRVLNGIVAYSVEVVTLSESLLNGPERAVALADFLERMLQPVLEEPKPELHLTSEQLLEIIETVREQEKLLDALSAAQPLVDEVSRSTVEVLNDMNLAQKNAADEITQSIDLEYAEILQFTETLKDQQIIALQNVQRLHDYRHGDSGSFQTLMKSDASLKEVVQNEEKPSTADLQAIEQRLIYKLSVIKSLKEQLGPDLEMYRMQQKELDDLLRIMNTSLKKAKISIIVWARSHRKLAAGITDPAKIDIFNLMNDAARTMTP